jgi:HlyD family secretion protein
MVIAGAVVVGALGLWHLRHKKATATTTLRTVPVKRGNLVTTIDATGTVEPEEVVDVGAQVAGQIIAFGKDKNGKPVDYGSVVEEGTVLAQIDESLYAADLSQAKAQLEQSRANRLSAEATVLQMKAKLEQAQADWNRAQKLGPSEALAPTAYDAYKATYETAKANLAAAQAAVEQAKAAISQAGATVERAQRNVAYCTIKSPVKGVIVDRRVNIGQTVVSSLNAPSLFLIAKDLTRIQVWVSVNEADIGHIQSGQPVTFAVDAFSGQTFHGQVGKVRLNATMTQNVVTYTVEVTTDNSDGRLLPYLTANAQFEIDRRENVLLVPNAALRWSPRKDQIAPEFRQEAQSATHAARAHQPTNAPTGSVALRGTVWVEQQRGLVRPVNVRIGLTDGTMTEVQGSDLAEGMPVVNPDQPLTSAARPASGGSPFTPQIGRSRTPQSGPSASIGQPRARP